LQCASEEFVFTTGYVAWNGYVKKLKSFFSKYKDKTHPAVKRANKKAKSELTKAPFTLECYWKVSFASRFRKSTCE